MTFQTLASSAQKMIGDNSPLILTGIGAAGVITTAILTGKASIKATRVLDVYRYDQDPKAEMFITKKQAAGHVWKLYIPPVATGIVTVGAIIMANRIGTRRAAAMASAYVLSQEAFLEYKDKVVEKLGESKERAIHDDIAQDRVNANPVTEHSIVVTDGGNSLCYESLSGRYFNSSMEEMKAAQNNLNHHILRHQYASLTEFYDLLGLDRTGLSDDIGWSSDEMLELTFTSTIASDGRPCLVMQYQVAPLHGYTLVH